MKRRGASPRLMRVRTWLLPSLLGPSLGACLFVVAYSLASGVGLASVVAETIGACALAFVLGAVLCLVDVALLVARLRTPPTAARAWVSSSLAGAGAVLLWRMLRPALLSAPSSHLLAALAAVLASALLARWLTGEKPSSWMRFS